MKTTIIQVYTPTNDREDEVKQNFYDQLQRMVKLLPQHNMILVQCDANARVGKQLVGKEGNVGKYGAPLERNDIMMRNLYPSVP
jgi:exonuclease III